MKKIFILAHDEARRRAAQFAMEAPLGWRAVFEEPKRKSAQSDKFHAMIGEIAKQIEHIGRKWDADDMKRLLVDEFSEEMRIAGTPLHHDGRVTISFDGRRTVQLGIQTAEFYVKEAAQFIEFLYAFAAQRGVTLSE